MSVDGFVSSSAPELVEAILDGLRSDESLEPTFGMPIRLYDDETRRPYYPYAVLERHETSDSSASETSSFEHQFQFATSLDMVAYEKQNQCSGNYAPRLSDWT